MAEPIKTLFGFGPKEACIRFGAHRRNLANAVEPFRMRRRCGLFVRLLWPLVMAALCNRGPLYFCPV